MSMFNDEWKKANLGKLQSICSRGVNASNRHGETPLLIAAMIGNERWVEKLLEKSADPNQADKRGTTPLMLSAIFGYENISRKLIQYGADIPEELIEGLRKIKNRRDLAEMLEQLKQQAVTPPTPPIEDLSYKPLAIAR